MKKTKFTDQQIAFALKQSETGVTVLEEGRNWVSARQPFIPDGYRDGKRNLVDWE